MYSKFILIIFFAIGLVSCTSKSQSPGQQLYISNCASCHGVDGKLGASGAKDLSASTMDPNLTRTIIANGKGTMPAFKKVLEPEQIEEIVTYINTLHK